MEMSIETMGPWVLLAVGAILLLIAGLAILLGRPAKWPWIWIFGLACAGIGAYGPVFMRPYGEWLKPILAMMERPGESTYAAAFQQVGDGKVPPQIQEMTLTYALNNPVRGMDEALDTAIERGSNPQGTEALADLRGELRDRQEVATRLADLIADAPAAVADERPTFTKLDPATRFYLQPKLSALPPDTRARLQITPRDLEEMKAPTPTFVPNLRKPQKGQRIGR